MFGSRRHVSVHVGVERPRQVAEVRSKVAIFAVLPPTAALPGDAWPAWRLKRPGTSHAGQVVEHLRIPAGVDTTVLPGLSPPHATQLRDAVRLAFAGGARTVDLVLLRSPGLTPGDLSHPDALQLLLPFLQDTAGLAVVLPDAPGAPTVGLRAAPPEARLAALVDTVQTWAPSLAEAYSVGLVDLPDVPPAMLFRALDDLHGADVALCAFTGRAADLRVHGWRSAAALLGGQLAGAALPSDGLVGHTFELPGGRPRGGERLVELGIERPGRTLPEFAEHAVVELKLGPGSQVTIASDPVLRAPTGAWTLPMTRTAKLVHQRLVITANLFVFRSATPDQALVLQNALRLALDAFEKKELVGGPLAGEPSRVQVQAVPDPAQPALVAQVTTFLRPWLRKLQVDLLVRPGDQARVEVA